MKLGAFTATAAAGAPGKYYSLGPDGTFQSVMNGAFSRARYQTVDLPTLAALRDYVQGATSMTHLTLGTAEHAEAEAYPAAVAVRLLASGDGTCPETGLPITTRTKADVAFREGPGALWIDSDGIGDADQVWGQIIAAVPALASHAVLHMSSTGARIFGVDGIEHRGDTGLHSAFHVMDATDIPRALEVLHKRLVLAGYGMHRLSSVGTFLNRSAVDLYMRAAPQPAYIHAHVGEGLIQDKRITLRPGTEVMDSRAVLPPLTADQELGYQYAVAAAKLALAPEGEQLKAGWKTAQMAEHVARGVGETEARQAVEAALGGILAGDAVLVLSDGTQVTVRDVLADPETYHGKPCFDPIEPRAGRGSQAKIYSAQPVPKVHSFNHGPHTYLLLDMPPPGLGAQGVPMDMVTKAQADLAAVEAHQCAADPVQVSTEHVLGALQHERRAGALPEGWRRLEGVVGLVCDAGRYVADAVALAEWLVTQPGLREQVADWIVCYTDLTRASLEMHLGGICKALGTPRRDTRKQLQAALDAQARLLPVLPPVIGLPEEAEEPDLQEVERAREAAELLATCRHIADDPIKALDAELTRQGVVGERPVAKTVFLTLMTSVMPKLTNLAVKGQSSAGKSHMVKAVVGLFDGTLTYTISSMSPKALIYAEPGTFGGVHIFLEEGEALVRDKGEKNELAEMLRVLLSEGRLRHDVVERTEAGQFHVRRIEQPGPTGLITTTTRAHLDEEIETRMMSVWTDESADHTREVVKQISAAAEDGAEIECRRHEWRAFGEWLRHGANRVRIPFAREIAQAFPTRAVRARRDINTFLGLIKASAIAHQHHREIDAEGRVVANQRDYELARECVNQSLGEAHDIRVSANAEALLKKLHALVEAGKAAQQRFSGPLPGTLPKYLRQVGETYYLQATVAEFTHLLDVSRSTFYRHTAHALHAGLLEHATEDKKTWRITDEGMRVVNGEQLNALPSFESLFSFSPDPEGD